MIWIHFVQLHKAAAHREKHRLTLTDREEKSWPVEFRPALCQGSVPWVKQDSSRTHEEKCKAVSQALVPFQGSYTSGQRYQTHIYPHVSPQTTIPVSLCTQAPAQEDRLRTSSSLNLSTTYQLKILSYIP